MNKLFENNGMIKEGLAMRTIYIYIFSDDGVEDEIYILSPR